MCGERAAGQRVEPVVEVADDQGRQMRRLAKLRMLEQVPHLPVPFAFGQAEMPVHQVERSLRRLDHGELCTARLASPATQRDLVRRAERPAREDEVAVASALEPHVELIEMGRRIAAPR